MSEKREGDAALPAAAKTAEVDAFLRQVASMPAARPANGRGRLIFAMDATASRGPTWDRACQLQGEMFEATAALGGLEVQLVFYRGFNECKASRWLGNAASLHRAMRAVFCVGGQTQIARVLGHALNAAAEGQVNAVVFVGDAMEESLDTLLGLAGELGLRGVPVFLFHEGGDPVVARGFKEIARVTRGAYCPFDAASADQLRALLGAVAAYAAGGRRALADYGKRTGGAALLLARDVGGG
ncbi:MAG TPA: VWA domain-containing protein [Stellaceae bacterium]|nr:VWA domain-containing protein [Stellaceae bacterium]